MASVYTGVATIDKRLQIVNADEQFYDYIGAENYAAITKIIHPDGLPHFKMMINDLDPGDEVSVVVRIITPSGQVHHVFTELRGINSVSDGETYVEIKLQDIELLGEKLANVCDENKIYSCFVELTGEHLFIYNQKQDYLEVFKGGNLNRTYMFRGNLEEFKSRVYARSIITERDHEAFEVFCEHLRQGTKRFEAKVLFLLNDADPENDIHLITGETIRNSLNETVTIGVVSRRNHADGSMSEFAKKDFDRDITTGLLTKKAILSYTEDLLSRKPKYNVNLCIVDIDNFKAVNDTLGHMFGDEVLSKVAGILKEAVAGKGIVGRIGGDEMFILLEGINNLADLRGVLRCVRNNVEWAYKDRPEVPKVTCSIGVSTYPSDSFVYEDLFKIADKMLYRAKEKGKNRYVIYAPDVHGNVLKEDEGASIVNNTAQRQDKEELVLRMMEFATKQINRPFHVLLQDIGLTFGLDEVHLIYNNQEKRVLDSYWSSIGDEKNESSISDFANEENFVHLYREHNMAVIDKLDLIEQLCPGTHNYMLEHNIKSALLYKMNCVKHSGYIEYTKKSDMSRKWSDSDIANLTYLSKILELLINDQ